MTVLVTGGGGFLGSAIVARLLERGETVRILARSDYPTLRDQGVAAYRGDIADAEAVDRAVAGCSEVIHVAARAGIGVRAEPFERTNVEGTRNVIASCLRHGVPRLVFTSTPSVVSQAGRIAGGEESLPYPASTEYLAPYPRTKAEAERMVRDVNGSDLRTLSLRPHLIWGPGDNHLIPRLVDRARRGRLRRIGRTQPIVDTTYITNAAEAHVLALDALRVRPETVGGRALFISNGEPWPLWDLVDQILDAVGVAPPPARHVPFALAETAGRALEGMFRLAGSDREPPMTRFLAHQLGTDHWFDISAARNLLGYAPTISLQDGLDHLRQHFSGRRRVCGA